MRTYDIEEKEFSISLDALVVALCRDYPRRDMALKDGSVSRRTAMEYTYINLRVFDGAAEIVGAADALTYVREIGEKVGYAFTSLDVSERTYKLMKAEVKRNIARKLHLCD